MRFYNCLQTRLVITCWLRSFHNFLPLLSLPLFLTAIAIFGFANSALATTYTAKLLHPLDGYYNTRVEAASSNSQVGVGVETASNSLHALLWSGTPASLIDLNPSGFALSEAYSSWGGYQVGLGVPQGLSGDSHALLWNGTSASVVDLDEHRFGGSRAFDIWDDTQVGSSGGGARLWHGTPNSGVNLHPAGAIDSVATGVWGNQQIGRANFANYYHAVLWSGSAESVVDLHPISGLYSQTVGEDIFESYQVGTGEYQGTTHHALFWSGTAESVIDLHPVGFAQSFATGIRGNTQVGVGYLSYEPLVFDHRALAWNGTADNVTNLHQFLANLPLNVISSDALGIGDDGTIVGWCIG